MSHRQERPQGGINSQFLDSNVSCQPPHGLQQFDSTSFPWANQGNSTHRQRAPQPHNIPNSFQFPPAQIINSLNFSRPPPSNFQKTFPPPPFPPLHNIPQNNSSSFPPPPVQEQLSPFSGTQVPSGAPHHYVSNVPPFPQNVSFNRPPPEVANTFRPYTQPPPARNSSFYARFAPPSTSVTPNSMTDKSMIASQQLLSDKALGCQKLENWLQVKKKHIKPEHRQDQAQGKPSVKVWDFMNKLKEMQDLINSLSTQVDGLTAAASSPDEVTWEASKRECDSLKEKISGFGHLLENGFIQGVGKKLNCIQRKRARMKKARKTKFDESQALHQQWNEKSKAIDKWQERLRLKILEENTEKRRKAAADRTLSKVTREIQDASRLIDTMLGLEKLRLIRRDAAQKRGDSDIGESRQTFEEKIKDMTRLVKAQLECYKEEESKLKHVLKSEEEEKSKLERESREEMARLKQEEEDAKLRLILFGPDDTKSHTDHLFPFTQYYRQAGHSLAAFLQIRQEWDAYLVPRGTPASSCIPSTWVIPDPPSSLSWSAALQ
ncbi:programmed cell death protein 7 [Elysia marginata]|uniref:Programmed cell death protein 7 n=1 Tax=Elysia marginata TaxID=1093978 RepID=A0AAV4GR84_9GAST|nr:programmed cell death protein 7 [Elysia marginata]